MPFVSQQIGSAAVPGLARDSSSRPLTSGLNTRSRKAPISTKEPQWIQTAQVPAEAREGKIRFKIRDLLADEWCSQAVLDFLFATDVGRLAQVPVQRLWVCAQY